MGRYLTIKEFGLNEIIIEKSRFITYISKVKTEKEAQDFITQIKKKHYDATHNCSAYIVGETKLHQKANDDGEPSGTAGVPMLEVLKRIDLTDTVVVVTRYFGGIKLGAGGLIRAYSKSVSECINNMSIVELKPFQEIKIQFDYSLVGMLDSKLSTKSLSIINKEYTDKIEYTLIIEEHNVTEITTWLTDITSGNIKISLLDIKLMEIEI